jgi:hypothetical protein
MDWSVMIPILSAAISVATVGSIVIAAWVSQRRMVSELSKDIQAKVEATEKAINDELVSQ